MSAQGPPDNCPKCMTVTCWPATLNPAEDWDGVIANYRCPGCGHRWWTSFATYGLDLPEDIAIAASRAGRSDWSPEPVHVSALLRERLAALRASRDGKRPGAA